MRWLATVLALGALSSPAFCQETTGNLVPSMSEFTVSGGTATSSQRGCGTGEFCTGNASNGGTTYTSNFDVPLTEAEIQAGFTANTSIDVTSHPSNATLSTCTSLTQRSDCRDIFRVTLSFLESSSVVEKFEHQVELDFSGTREFTFSDQILENDYTSLTGQLELFGIDAGFHSGAFGPKFSDPSVSLLFQTVVEQQILDQIAFNDALAAEPPPELVEDIPQIELDVAPEPVAADLGPSAPEPVVEAIEPVEIAPVDSAPEPEQQEEQMAEARIEAEMEPEPEPEPEPQEQEPEESEEQEQPEPVEPETQEPEPESQPEPEQEPEPEPEEQEQAEPETQQERRKEAAEKAVAKIAPSQRYSAASQTTTIVAMGMISPKLITGAQIPDTQGFFTGATVPDGPPMSNPAQDYVVFGASNAAHEALVRLQWSK